MACCNLSKYLIDLSDIISVPHAHIRRAKQSAFIVEIKMFNRKMKINNLERDNKRSV